MASENYLTESIRYLCKGETIHSEGAFLNSLRHFLINKTWVYIPIREETNSISYVTYDNLDFLVMFSEMKFAKTGPGISIVCTDINMLFDTAEQCDVAGVSINPFTPDCHCAITKDKFHLVRN